MWTQTRQVKRKLPVDLQLLNYAQKDIGIKRCLVEWMQKMDEQYAKSVAGMSKNRKSYQDLCVKGFTPEDDIHGPTPSCIYATAPPANSPTQHYVYSTPLNSHFVQLSAPRSRSGTPSSCWDDAQQEDWWLCIVVYCTVVIILILVW